MLSRRCSCTASSRHSAGQAPLDLGLDEVRGASTGRSRRLGPILAVMLPICAPVPIRRTYRWPSRPVRLLHLLDGVFTQANLARRSSGVARRRQHQRLALAQRLLDPLPRELQPQDRGSQLFWRGLRWGTLGMAVAWLLRA